MTKRTSIRYKEAFKLRLGGHSFAEIARQLCVSRQYIHELLSPPPFIKEKVVTSARGRCNNCNLWVGHSGHVHHVGVTGLTKEEYGDIKNLVLLCASCHSLAHRGRSYRKASKEHPASKTLAKRLFRFRVMWNLTQHEFAKRANLTGHSIVARAEDGASLRLDTLHKILRVLDGVA